MQHIVAAPVDYYLKNAVWCFFSIAKHTYLCIYVYIKNSTKTDIAIVTAKLFGNVLNINITVIERRSNIIIMYSFNHQRLFKNYLHHRHNIQGVF